MVVQTIELLLKLIRLPILFPLKNASLRVWYMIF
jgi:hypothetical protein